MSPFISLPSISACNADDLSRFLVPAPIMQMVASPALADDIVGRVDVTTSTFFFSVITMLCEQILSSAFVGNQLNTGTPYAQSCTNVSLITWVNRIHVRPPLLFQEDDIINATQIWPLVRGFSSDQCDIPPRNSDQPDHSNPRYWTSHSLCLNHYKPQLFDHKLYLTDADRHGHSVQRQSTDRVLWCDVSWEYPGFE